MKIKSILEKIIQYSKSLLVAVLLRTRNMIYVESGMRKGIKKTLFFFNLLLIFIPPIILATPFPPYIGIYKLVYSQPDNPKPTEISVPEKAQSLGVPFFSKLTGIEAYTLKTEICLWNRNDVFLGGEYKSKKDLSDGAEAGAMEINIEYADGEVFPLYSPRDALRCLPLRDGAGTPTLKNNPIVRGPNPFGQPIVEESGDGPIVKIPVYSQGIDSAKTRIFAIPDFKSREYLFNLVLFFLAWSLLYVHIIKIGTIIINTWGWSRK